jgi:hypothetical protein
MPLNFKFENGPMTLVPDSSIVGPFILTLASDVQFAGSVSNSSLWSVVLRTDVPGDYSATIGWRAVPASLPNSARGPCVWTTELVLHARVGGDGGADAGSADASDGGADLAPDAL